MNPSINNLRISLLVVSLVISTGAQSQVLKNEPTVGEVPQGKKVLVDDGTCPAGQIKEVTGGNKVEHIARSTQCVPRGRKK